MIFLKNIFIRFWRLNEYETKTISAIQIWAIRSECVDDWVQSEASDRQMTFSNDIFKLTKWKSNCLLMDVDSIAEKYTGEIPERNKLKNTPGKW